MRWQKTGLVLIAAMAIVFLLVTAFFPMAHDAQARSSRPNAGDEEGRQTSAQTKAGEDQGAAPSGATIPASQSSAKIVDVRFTKAASRILTDNEMAALRDSLRWEPELVQIPNKGVAVSHLMDKDGRNLGSIQIQWTRTVVSKDSDSGARDSAVGSFTLQMENATSCGFLGQAELVDKKGDVIVASLDLDSWVGLHQPAPGETIRVEGEASLPIRTPALTLKPVEVGSTLSACTTPQNP